MIQSAFNTALHILNNLPPWQAACLLGWAGSIAITQPAKFIMPLAWNQDTRAIVSRVLATFSAMACTAMAYFTISPLSSGAAMLLAALFTGIWSPIAFALLLAGLRRHPRTAWVADVLSGDVRGVLAGKPRGEP